MPEVRIAGGGTVVVPGEPAAARAALLEPAVLRHLVPGAETLEHLGAGRYRAVIGIGVGPLRVRQTVALTVADGAAAGTLDLSGTSEGALAHGRATGHATFEPVGEVAEQGRTRIAWRYEGVVGGVAALAGRGAAGITARAFAARFFARLRARLGP